MFTIVNSVLLRPLPFGDADRVLSVWTRYEPSSGYNFPEFSLSDRSHRLPGANARARRGRRVYAAWRYADDR